MRKYFLIVLSAFMLSFASMAVWAEVAIGVVDVQKVLDDSKKATNLEEDFQDENKKDLEPLVEKINAMREALQNKFEGLQRDVDTMSESERQRAEADLQKDNEALQKEQAKLNSEAQNLQEKQQRRLQRLLEDVQKAIDKVARSKKLDLVLQKQITLYADKDIMDITRDVTKELDD